MFFLILFKILLASTTIDDDGKLTVDISPVTVASVSKYKDTATSLVLTKQSVEVEANAFKDFKLLKTVLVSSQSSTFGDSVFSGTTLDTVSINSQSTHLGSAFSGSTVKTMTIASQNVEFGQLRSAKINTLIITTQRVSFGNGAFKQSSIVNLQIPKSQSVEFEEESFANSPELKTVTVKAQSILVEYRAFAECTSLASVSVDAQSIQVDSSVFCNCPEGLKISYNGNIDADECYLGCCDKKSSGGSSSGSDSDSGISAKTLGNMKIESVYLGTSANIVFNLNFMVSIMKRLRKTFGNVIPSPEIVHSAIWVGEQNANDDTVGAIFVYGRYFNKCHKKSFLFGDGAKGYVATLKEFKKKYPTSDLIKLNAHKDMKLLDFIKEIKESGKWGASDYNWPTNNCQHFTSKMIEILQATRDSPSSQDWIDIPKSVLNSLEANEKKK